MKKIKTIIFATLVAILGFVNSAFAQSYEHNKWLYYKNTVADELLGRSEDTKTYMYFAHNGTTFCGSVSACTTSIDKIKYFTITNSKGIFDYNYDDGYYYVTALIRFYDENDNLVDKCKRDFGISKKDKTCCYINDEKVVNYIKNSKGYVRVIIPRYKSSKLDIKFPSLASEEPTPMKMVTKIL